jgi:site-specific DNA-methyltransferase (adenine-specific)
VNYKSRDGRRFINDDRSDWIKPAFAELYRVLKPDTFCVTFTGFTHFDHFLSAWRSTGFIATDVIVWTKPYSSSERFIGRFHEQAYLLAKGNPHKPHMRLPSVLEEWQYTGNRLHPTQKPVMALVPLIMAFSCQDDIVLDPFAGSATTAVAALQCNRRYICIEQDDHYCRVAKLRLKRIVQREAL